MSRQEALQQFRQALKAGQKCYRECVHRGRYPYPQVLEERLRGCAVAGRVDLGVLDIPIAQIIGTNTAGRQAAFAANFMPLLDLGTEFASKWVALCEAHLGDTGITDPIRCFEYMGCFYVQEGNKRVSVLKSFEAPTIRAYVTRVLPVYSDDPAVRVYYEFLHFYGLCGLYQVHFNRVGDYPKLQAALGFDADHIWSDREKRAFLTAFYTFRTAYYKLSQEPPVTTAEALLVWLHTYTLGDLRVLGPAELEKSIRAVWTELTAYARGGKIEMQTDAEPEASGSGLLGLLAGRMIPGGTLRAAFVHECAPEKSPWIREHDKGRQQLEQALGDAVSVRTYLAADYPCTEDALEQAVSDGAQVIFTTTVPLIFACRKLAPKYPGVRFLNCSVDMPYPGVRTYYGRIYEAKFLLGAIAGALAEDSRIGYVADGRSSHACGHQCLCARRAADEPTRRDRAALVVLRSLTCGASCGRGAARDLRARSARLGRQPGLARTVSGPERRAGLRGASGVELGRGLYPAGAQHPARRLGRAERGGRRQLLVGLCKRRGGRAAHGIAAGRSARAGAPAARRADPR